MAQQSYKKFVASAATATLVASALIPVASANVTTSAFTDVPASYKEAVDFVVSNNIASGKTETQFGISQQILRGDAAIMIAAAAGLNDKDAPASKFSDVPTRGALAINSLKAAGVISGKSDTKFGFNDNITRGEAALMLQKAFDLKSNGTANSFSDVSSRYDDAVDALVANKVTNGINKTQFGTTNNIKRGDFAKFLFALEDQINIEKLEVASLKANSTTSFDVVLEKAVSADADVASLLKVKVVLADGTVVMPKATDVKVSEDRKTITVEHKDNDLAGLTGTLSVNGKDLAFDYDKTASVVGVKAINATDLGVTVKGGAEDFKASDFEVTVNGTKAAVSATKVSATEYKLQLTVPLVDGDVVVVKGTGEVLGSATVTYKDAVYTKVEAVSDIVYKGLAGQSLKIKVDGGTVTASDLAKQGYTVTFQATEQVFPSTATTSTTGLLDATAGFINTGVGDTFKYKVSIQKDNKVITSDNATVTVAEETTTATSAIKSTDIKVTTSGNEISSLKSGKLVKGETAEFTEVVADLQDGRKNVNLVELTGSNVQYESSDVTIAKVNSTGQIVAGNRTGKVTITIKSGTQTKDVLLEVVAADRELTTATLSSPAVKLVQGSKKKVTMVAKDQYGDSFDTTAIATDITSVDEAVAGGVNLTTTGAPTTGTADRGTFTVEITAEAAPVGTGNVVLNNGSKKVITIPVSVAKETGLVKQTLVGNGTKIDLNPTSSDSSITFRLENLFNGHYKNDANLQTGTNTIEIYDATKPSTPLYTMTAGAGETSFTVDAADLILETTSATNTVALLEAQDAAAVTAAAVGSGISLASFETGTALVVVKDSAGKEVDKINFSVVDTAANATSATFSNTVEFTASNNAGELKLSDLLTAASTTAAPHDGVLRYQVVNDEALAFYSASADVVAYDYEAGDILVGKVVGTPVTALDTVTLSNNGTPELYLAKDLEVAHTIAKEGDKAQFNFYKRGDVSVGKGTFVKKVNN